MDDVTFAGDLQTVKRDIITISESHRETGLRLNTAKCEIIMEDFTMIDGVDMFRDFIRVNKADMTLLGSPILKGKAQDKAIEQKTKDLSRAIDRLELLHAHDALVVLINTASKLIRIYSACLINVSAEQEKYVILTILHVQYF